MPNKNEEKEYIVPRKGETDLRFRGILLAEVREDHEFGECTAAFLYRTVGGNYIAQLVTGKHNKKNSERGAKCTNAQEILSFYTIPPAAPTPVKRGRGAANTQAVTPQPGHLLDIGKRALEQAGKIDPALKDSHVEFVE